MADSATLDAQVSYSRKAAALMNSEAVLGLPLDQLWAVRDALAQARTEDDLPSHVRVLFDEQTHAKIVEARYTERLHPRGRGGKWIRGMHRIEQVASMASTATKLKVGKGRKGRKAKPVGWLEAVREHQKVPVLKQSDLVRRRRQAFSTPREEWKLVSTGDGDVYAQGDATLTWRSRKINDNVEWGYELRIDGGEPRWIESYPGDGIYDVARRAMPERRSESDKFMDEWYGGPGRPGLYQRVSGDPGEQFVAQHERIMDAGARIDAEIVRRMGDAVKRHREAVKAERDAKKAVVLAEKHEEVLAFTGIGREMLGWLEHDPEQLTPDALRERLRLYNREAVKLARNQDKSVMTTANAQLWDMHEYDRFNVAERNGIDLQAAHDAGYEARVVVFRAADERRAAEQDLADRRRAATWEVLGETRRFGNEFEITHDYSPDVMHYDETTAKALDFVAVFLPHDWIVDSNRSEYRLLVGEADQRGSYGHARSFNVQTGVGTSVLTGNREQKDHGAMLPRGAGVALHEMVHRAEYVHDGIKGAEWTFYQQRVSPGVNRTWETPERLIDLIPNSGYEEHEMARRDHFTHPYSGKSYGDDMESAWELLTMGVQDLATGEHGIIDKDEEYRQFVLGALAIL